MCWLWWLCRCMPCRSNYNGWI